ncbi:unnamed protein product [Notodromas monacha]|uniref:Metal transporter CNNM4 n=1 Tax=Notodromas monacha TaxID=399045 RepID=A0A7R9BMN8_9CRUS|nr:unnamed protein product [Notodromas monacha]CAG0917443.1 unnamed protein product [Notodromas monacha]
MSADKPVQSPHSNIREFRRIPAFVRKLTYPASVFETEHAFSYKKSEEPCSEDDQPLKYFRIKPNCIQKGEIFVPLMEFPEFDFTQFRPSRQGIYGNVTLCVRKAESQDEWTAEHTGVSVSFVYSEPERFFLPSREAQLTDDVQVYGFRIEWVHSGSMHTYIDDNGISVILAHDEAVMRMFGKNLQSGLRFKFAHLSTDETYEANICDKTRTTEVFVSEADPAFNGTSALLRFELPDMPDSGSRFYLCMQHTVADGVIWVLVGSTPGLTIRSSSKLLTTWLQWVCIAMLLLVSGLFSGLNLGLLALDRTDLQIISTTGSEKEKYYAKQLIPVRKLGNYLLSSIVLANVLVNATLTVLLDDLTSGVTAVVLSTAGITIFGEIVPQAICSRHGLAIGAWTLWITKSFMIVTCPLSFPISKLLDFLLGEEIGNQYNRERLKELMKISKARNTLGGDEFDIISGALDLKRKTVREIMTKIDDVFMLSYDAVLDFSTMSEIRRNGYSRIPVFDKVRSNIVGILYVKDLVLMDPDDNTPLKTLCDYYRNPCFFTFHDTPLDEMFRALREGDKGHLAFVQEVVDDEDHDPFYEIIGIVTLEDVIEEIVQSEIMDETDIFIDNRSKRRIKRKNARTDMSMFSQAKENVAWISPQLIVAALHYLTTHEEAFSSMHVAERILRKLLQQPIYHQIKLPKSHDHRMSEDEFLIYKKGKVVDYFVLILEGKAQVTVGNENLALDAGPFSRFGRAALGFSDICGDAPAPNFFIGASPLLRRQESLEAENNSEKHGRCKNKGQKRQKHGGAFSEAGMDEGNRWFPKVCCCDQYYEGQVCVDCHGRRMLTTSCPSLIVGEPTSGIIYFTAEYTVRAVTDMSYLKIHSAQYMAAKRATILYNKLKPESVGHDDYQMESEVEKIWRDAETSVNRNRHPSGVSNSPGLAIRQASGLAPKFEADLVVRTSPSTSGHSTLAGGDAIFSASPEGGNVYASPVAYGHQSTMSACSSSPESPEPSMDLGDLKDL